MSKEQLTISNTNVFYRNSPKLNIVQQPDEFGSKMKPFLRSGWLKNKTLRGMSNSTNRSSLTGGGVGGGLATSVANGYSFVRPLQFVITSLICDQNCTTRSSISTYYNIILKSHPKFVFT